MEKEKMDTLIRINESLLHIIGISNVELKIPKDIANIIDRDLTFVKKSMKIIETDMRTMNRSDTIFVAKTLGRLEAVLSIIAKGIRKSKERLTPM